MPARLHQRLAAVGVPMLEGDTTMLNHPVVGEIHLHRDKLPVDGPLLALYYADVGSDSAEKLALLPSLIEPST